MADERGADDHNERSTKNDPRQALDDLARRFRTPLFRYFQRRLANEADAEELTQEVFYRLARRPEALRPETVQGYIFEAAANLIRDRARRHTVRNVANTVSSDDIEIASEAPSAQRILEGRSRLRVLLSAIADLPPKCRAAFLLHRYRGMSHTEIATHMGISTSAVEKHMSKAIAHLRERMREDDDGLA